MNDLNKSLNRKVFYFEILFKITCNEKIKGLGGPYFSPNSRLCAKLEDSSILNAPVRRY